MEYKPNNKPHQYEAVPMPKIVKYEDLHIVLNNEGLPVAGSDLRTVLVYDNGTKILFQGKILDCRINQKGKVFANIINSQNPKGILFPVPDELIEKAKASRQRRGF